MGDRNLEDARPSSSHASTQVHPTEYPNRRLIVCCDGTTNTGDNAQPLTNVARIARCVDDSDTYNGKNLIQIVHYQPGLGTGTNKVVNMFDGMRGKGISKGIRAAYAFISLNWLSSRDEIILIGFSRGAFTVRCVAQFIHDVGLLTKSGLRHLPQIFRDWRNLNPGDEKAKDKLKMRCDELREWGELVNKEVQIEACAVWDTVKAINGTQFSTVGETIPKNTKFAVQALALGEKRNPYKPMKWNKPAPDSNQSLTQYWFAGTHSEVGGGSDEPTLSNIALAWMIGQLTDHVQFNHESLWAITTTRAWSKPSPIYDQNEESGDNSRVCKVTATSDITPALLRSTYGWLSWFMRIAGWGWRDPDKDDIHYSVHILRHLGIAKYENVKDLSDEHLLREVMTPDKKKDFEGDIIEKWAQHILCAHIRLKQARNTAETIKPSDPRYKQRLGGELVEQAKYEAAIPITAILSAFHRLNKDENVKRRKEVQQSSVQDAETPQNAASSKPSQLDLVFKQVQKQSSEKKDKRSWLAFKKPAATPATFEFERIDLQRPQRRTTTSSLDEAGKPTELSIKNSQLIFTREYTLLMGRCHDVSKVEAKTTVQKAKAFFRRNEECEAMPRCEKCAEIWKPEVSA